MGQKVELKMDMINVKKEGISVDDITHTLKVTFTIEAKANLDLFSRIVNLQRQGAPLYCIIGSDQAKMDLRVQEVSLVGGELVPFGRE